MTERTWTRSESGSWSWTFEGWKCRFWSETERPHNFDIFSPESSDWNVDVDFERQTFFVKGESRGFGYEGPVAETVRIPFAVITEIARVVGGWRPWQENS